MARNKQKTRKHNHAVKKSKTKAALKATCPAGGVKTCDTGSVPVQPSDDEVFDGEEVAAAFEPSVIREKAFIKGRTSESMAYGDCEDSTADFPINTLETVEQFERSLLEHRNSMGSVESLEDSQNSCKILFDEPTGDSIPSKVLEKEDELAADTTQNDTNLTANISVASSHMNAAFLASESQLISFESGSATSETSGEQGYTTGRETVTSPESNNKTRSTEGDSMGMNNSAENIEQTLCSSRIEDDSGAMPQPDISPLTEDDSDKDASVRVPRFVDERRDGTTLEERVPHLHCVPRSLASSRSDSEKLANDASESEVESRILPQDVVEAEKELPQPRDTETDDDILYDDDSQNEDDEVKKELVPVQAKKTKKPEIIEVTMESTVTGDAPPSNMDPLPTTIQPGVEKEATPATMSSEVPQDTGAEGDQLEKKRKRRVRMVRRRWLDCCTLL